MDEEGWRQTEAGVVLQFALMLSKCSNSGDFIEACIWASLMCTCTPRAYKQTDRRQAGPPVKMCNRVRATTDTANVTVANVVVVAVVVVTRIVSTAMRRDAEVSPFALARETVLTLRRLTEKENQESQKGDDWSSMKIASRERT